MNKSIAPTEVVERKPPVNLDAKDLFCFEHEFMKRLPETFINSLGNVIVLPNGYIISGFSPVVFPESFAFTPTGFTASAKIVCKRIAYGVSSKPGIPVSDGLFVTDEFSNGFFHWLGDVLPRMELLEAANGTDYLRSKTLVVPFMADFQYVLPSLAAFPVGNVRVLKKNESVFCHALTVCSSAAPTGNYRPSIMNSLRERFLYRYGSDKKPFRKVYISRSGAPKRRVTNESDLLPILERFGFEPIRLEELGFENQVKLLSEVSVLIGNHGAGLTNMMFMRTGASVAELRLRGDSVNNCFYSLSTALDLPYRYLLCDSARPGEDTHTADFFVDVRSFSKFLETIA